MNKKVIKKLILSSLLITSPILALPLTSCANNNGISQDVNNSEIIEDNKDQNDKPLEDQNPQQNQEENVSKPVQKPVERPQEKPPIIIPNESNTTEKLNLAKANLSLSLKNPSNVFVDDFMNHVKNENDLLNYCSITGEDSQCNYQFVQCYQKDNTNSVCVEYKISFNGKSVNKIFELSNFYHGKFENLYKTIKDNFSVTKGTIDDYHNYTARTFLNEDRDFQYEKYLNVDWEKVLSTITLPDDVLIFDQIPDNTKIDYSKNLVLTNFIVANDFNLDPKKPNTIIFTVEVKIGKFDKNLNFIPNDENNLTQTFNFAINDFKNEELTTKLDLANENQLITPSDAQTYKGTLINTNFSLIDEIGENAYQQRMGEKFTWEKFKKELMYQVRFALYQQFCDNFSEINYYITHDIEGKSITAIAEGIIKDRKDSQLIYPQHLMSSNEFPARQTLTPGQKVRIEISYSASNNNWKPTIQPDASDIINLATNSFSFAKGCDNIKNSKDLLTNAWFSFFPYQMKYNCYIDGKPIYELTPNHFIFWSFTANAKKQK